MALRLAASHPVKGLSKGHIEERMPGFGAFRAKINAYAR
jgi:hypothetical protein